MIAETALSDTSTLLAGNSVRSELVEYLRQLKDACGTLDRQQVRMILGQWYHPLHYFPTFLARLISVTPHLASRTSISRILWQELGEGDPLCAHEKVYLDTVGGVDLAPDLVAGAEPLGTTRQLVEGYEQASQQYLSGLGFLYGTEVVDLPMVATIGELMERSTGQRELAWVNIHVQQEPDHVESSNEALRPSFTPGERREIIRNAEHLWTLWIGFFRSIQNEILC
jgi:pyrroloquinoline quinone (PQQ) biosynthesis protein C